MDLIHAQKSARRFHSAAEILAARSMGLDVEEVRTKDYSLPIIVREGGGRIYVLNMGTKGQDDDCIAPYVVNGAFSLELHLKFLSYLESGQWIGNEHRLDRLFGRLSAARQQTIADLVTGSLASSAYLAKVLRVLAEHGVALEWSVESLLTRSSEAFVKWRYAFEGTAGSFAGYSEIQRALHSEIDKLSHGHPELQSN